MLSTFPIEVRVAAFFGLLWVAGVLFGLPVNLPDYKGFLFVERHYFRPVWTAFLLQLLLLYITQFRRVNYKPENPFLLVKLLPFIVFSVFLHFNFKAWMPLVNPHQFDGLYNSTDSFLSRLLQIFLTIRQFIASHAPLNLDFMYHHLFVVMFFISFVAHSIEDSVTRLRQLMLSVCLILLIGGISYWIAPAEGAYLYRVGVNVENALSQKDMHAMFLQVKNTGLLPEGYFTAPPAAMPSLHIAIALLFTWFAWRSFRWLLVLYMPIAGWLIIESVSSAWHYLIDLPAGLAVCAICIKLAIKWLPDREPEQQL